MPAFLDYAPDANQTAQTSAVAPNGPAPRSAGLDAVNGRHIKWQLKRANKSNPISLRNTFAVLADTWHQETDLLSSPIQKALDLSYLRIIRMGPAVLPFILEDLGHRGGQWYIALEALADDGPMALATAATTQQAKDAWLAWGRARHII